MNWGGMTRLYPTYILERGVYEKGLDHILTFTHSLWSLSRQPPLNCDVDDIFLHNHLIVEAGVVPNAQANIAEITTMSEFMDQPERVDYMTLELDFSVWLPLTRRQGTCAMCCHPGRKSAGRMPEPH